MSAYTSLEDHFGRIGRLSSATEMLYWDWATMMPKGGAGARSEQLATLKVLEHELSVDARIAGWASDAAGEDLTDWQRANVAEMRRLYAHATAVPADLVAARSRAGSACETCWRTARKENDFKTLAPLLTEVISLTRQAAQAKAEALGCSPYEALLDQYEPGGSTANIDAQFEALAAFLPDFTQAVLARQEREGAPLPLEGPFDIEAQRALGLKVMGALGFDFEHGRLDVSAHPFCGGNPDDVRITTRYRENDFVQGLMGVIHETGHALYERGLPAEWRFQPVGHARGMSMHESQSLLMEMQACRSADFLHYVSPIVREIFGGSGPAWEEANLLKFYTRVERGLIRVEADEVTYPAHVILRYRLERAMVAGDLEVVDLPGAWREGMLELVGVAPDDDKDGCMQDIHWIEGLVGYFPTYTLGAMTAAQLFDAATTANTDILPGIRTGDFGPLLTWLRENVHSQASAMSTDELLTKATGRPLDAQVFRKHLESRYLP